MEAFRFRVGLNSTEHTQKPTSKEASIINRNGFPTTETSLEELKTSLSKGMTFTPSYFKDGKRNNKNFEGTYVFALDFDDNQEPEEKIAQLKEYGIETNLYYPSFSDKPRHRKFRLVIVFDTPVEDKKSRDKIQLAIMEMVKDSDRACKDASRMFYGGATCELLSNKPNSLEERLIHLHNIINSTTVNKVTKGRNDNNLKKYTKRPIVIREKQKRNVRTTEDTMEMALQRDVHCLVTYNSIAAVEALILGKPVFVMGPNAAEPMANTDLSKINNPMMPTPEKVIQLCCNLAYGQFTPSEMVDGTAWRILNEFYDRK